MSSPFEAVKQNTSARQVAEFYGAKVNKNGMCQCPFHNDKTPSMKFNKEYYYCFGCGAKGDAISYVAELYGLSQYDAALKLINDMNLSVDIKGGRTTFTPSDRRRMQRKQNLIRIQDIFKDWCFSSVNSLCECIDTIKDLEEEFDKRYKDSSIFDVSELDVIYDAEPFVGYLLDILCTGTEEEKKELFIKGRKEVDDIVSRINDIRAGFMGRSGEDSGRGILHNGRCVPAVSEA
jgi:hypothetical protein